MNKFLQPLIVDDEKYVISSLQLSINWNTLNLLPPLTANSGKEALDIMENTKIDIVITDIQMPELNGLDFIKKLHDENKDVQTIIVSGYADFSYAKTALEYGVIGYCLKPVDEKELTNYLKQACKKQQELITPHFSLIELLDSTDTDEISDLLTNNNINSEKFYICTSINLPDLSSILDSTLTYKLGVMRYAYLKNTPFTFNESTLLNVNEQIGGIGYTYTSINYKDLKHELRSCITKAHQYFIFGKTTICKELPSKRHLEFFSKLTNFLNNNKLDDAVKLINKLIKSDLDTLNIGFAFHLCNLIFSNNTLNTSESDSYFIDYNDLIYEYSTFNNMITEIVSVLSQQTSVSSSNISAAKFNSNFLMLINYINEHFTENISLQMISEAVNMNPNYISQLFKKETNTTYVKYLNSLRIDYAKNLLDTSDLNIYDISEQSGFNDYFYFIKSFKKVVGISPAKYRDNNFKI